MVYADIDVSTIETFITGLNAFKRSRFWVLSCAHRLLRLRQKLYDEADEKIVEL